MHFRVRLDLEKGNMTIIRLLFSGKIVEIKFYAKILNWLRSKS